MKYRENMTPEEEKTLMEEVRKLDEVYGSMDECDPEDEENDGEGWYDERTVRSWRP